MYIDLDLIALHDFWKKKIILLCGSKIVMRKQYGMKYLIIFAFLNEIIKN